MLANQNKTIMNLHPKPYTLHLATQAAYEPAPHEHGFHVHEGPFMNLHPAPSA
jgi:Cu/Zn superoxide dismutase